MLRIITHIERLLLTHDCVILPKFGGFVLQTLPATYQEEEHLFRPMRKEVMFNVTLQHTDGLLSESSTIPLISEIISLAIIPW